MGELKSGIYDHLISEKLRHALDSLDTSAQHAVFEKLEEPLATDYLTRFLRARINQALVVVKADQRLALANRLIHSLSEFDTELSFLSSEKIESIAQILALGHKWLHAFPRQTSQLR